MYSLREPESWCFSLGLLCLSFAPGSLGGVKLFTTSKNFFLTGFLENQDRSVKEFVQGHTHWSRLQFKVSSESQTMVWLLSVRRHVRACVHMCVHACVYLKLRYSYSNFYFLLYVHESHREQDPAWACLCISGFFSLASK